MKLMKKNRLIKVVVPFLTIILATISCDKDFTTVGVDVIGNINFETSNSSFPVITYNKRVNPLQTNNLSSNLLGVYNDPLFGVTSANLVTQVNLATGSQGRTYGVNIRLDSIVLTIPYFSSVNASEPTDEDGNTNYVIDSIYGNTEAAMMLSIFRNNYFLRDFDPNSNFQENQKYYSSGETSQGVSIPVSELESELIYSDTLNIDNSQIILTTNNSDDNEVEEEETSRLTPSIRLKLDSLYFQEVIIDKIGEIELSNTNNFREYFRGLYFKVESLSPESSMFLLDLSSSNANLRVHFSSVAEFDDDDNDGIPNIADADVDGNGILDEDVLDTDMDGIKDTADADADGNGEIDDEVLDLNSDGINDDVVAVLSNTITMNLTGNKINLFDSSQLNASILSEVDNANTIDGDEKLFLKGGEGIIGIVDLFGGIESAEYMEFMSHRDEWIINEANLVFYEDESVIEENHEYDRLFVYDINNNTPLVDFFRDTPSTNDPINSIISHLGRRYTDEQGNNKFKIKITEHINNILLNDSTNTKLGLTLSTNVNIFDNSEILTTDENDELTELPTSTALTPKGTILYGNNTTMTDKKVKLEIYYTQPNN